MALPSTDQRLRAMHRVAWIMAPLISFPASFAIGHVKVPDAPWYVAVIIGAIMTPISGVLLTRVLVSSMRDLLVARLGSRDERQRQLSLPLTRLSNRLARATVALEHGDLGAVPVLLAEIPAVDRLAPIYQLVAQRKACWTGDAAAKHAEAICST